MENFENIQVGENVLCTYGTGRVEKLCKVTRVNATTFTICKGTFNKLDGKPTRHIWGNPVCTPVTDVLVSTIAREKERNTLHKQINTLLNKGILQELTIEDMREVLAIFNRRVICK